MVGVWGQGPFNLPDHDTGKYSHGFDPWRGPWKCRGVEGGCGGGSDIPPHDHSCCCSPCNHESVSICAGANGCCKCVPKYLCYTFTPTTPTATCKARAWLVPATGGSYTLDVGDQGAVTIRNGDPAVSGSAYAGYPCVWELATETAGIITEEPIDHSGAVNCMELPDGWEVSCDTGDCAGTLTFSSLELKKVPFIKKYWGVAETFSRSCGSCTSLCTVLCVRRGTAASTDYTRVDFVWDALAERWEAEDGSGQYISAVEYAGDCYVELTSISPVTFNGDLLPMNACARGFSAAGTDEADNWITVSCNPCSCWEYLCGTCRCVCPELCVVGVVDNVPFSTTLTWDKDYLYWTNGSFTVGLQKGEDGECELTVDGYADPTPLESCGMDVGGNISEEILDQISSGLVNYLYFFCKQCQAGCDFGTCLSLCDDVPQELTAELSAGDWQAMVGCDYCDPGFETVTFPLYLVFVPTAGVAGEWRWVGHAIISCSDCCGTKSNYYVSVDMGCDGIVYFTVDKPGTASTACTAQFDFTLPCGDYGVWDFTWETELPCGVLNGCMGDGTFVLSVTE